MKQPLDIPGIYDPKAKQPLPTVDWAARHHGPLFGLFTYPGSYQRHAGSIEAVGWKYLRMGPSPSRGDMKNIAEAGMDVSVHVVNAMRRPAYSTEEAFLQACEKSVIGALNRYPSLKYAHVWNEPNFGYLTDGTLEEKALLYGKLLLRVSKIIRERAPGVQILGFECARPGPNAVEFMEIVYRAYDASEIHAAYDVLAVHPGVHPTPPEVDRVEHWGSYSIPKTVSAIRGVWRFHHVGRKPIWFTEAGWPISQEDGGAYRMEPGSTVSPELQAAYACRYYALAARLGVDRVGMFFVEDSDGLNSGFFEPSGQWRMSAYAVQNMIRLMPNPRLAQVLSDGEDGVYAYLLERDVDGLGGYVTMVWTVEGTQMYEPDWSRHLVDMLGAESEFSGTVEIGPCPVYLI